MLATALALVLFVCVSVAGAAAAIDSDIQLLRSASGVEAASPELQAAWKRLAESPPEAMPLVLVAMNDAEPTGQNWLRSAADAIAERTLAEGGQLPAEQLRALVRNSDAAPRGRRAAYEWLVKVEPAAAEQLLPNMLDDPSIELRYDAVERVIGQALAEGESDTKRIELLNTALTSALDQGQLDQCAKQLGKLGREVDLTQVMGFLTKWKLIGPFDNTDKQGFAVAYPPEAAIDFDKTYDGKTEPVTWQAAESDGELGKLDLTETFGPVKGAVAYTATTFVSAEPQEAELRYSSPNATKVWLNGKLVADNEVYHSGGAFDQYRSRVQLQAGENVVLVKVCQNEQTQPWAQDWALQLRVTDLLGKGLPPSSDSAK